MKRSYLEVTFRKGKPLAAYLYLPRRADDRSVRVENAGPDINIDFAVDGRPIGIEILSPEAATLAEVNALLQRLRVPVLDAADLAPLAVA